MVFLCFEILSKWWQPSLCTGCITENCSGCRRWEYLLGIHVMDAVILRHYHTEGMGMVFPPSHATTGCHPLSHLVTDRRLRLFGHIAHSSPQEDHHRAVAAVIRGLPPDWKRPSGRPSHTWLRAVEADLGQQNIGLSSAWRKAAIRDDWRRIVDTATLQRSML